MGRKKIDETIRQGVKRAHEEGIARKKIADQFGISLSSVSRIIKQESQPSIQKHGAIKDLKTERQRRIEDLEKRVLELERKILAYEAKRRH